MMNEGFIITEQKQVESLLNQLDYLTKKKEFFKEQISRINEYEFRGEPDADLNIKKMAGRMAHMTRQQCEIRAKLRAFNPEFELKN